MVADFFEGADPLVRPNPPGLLGPLSPLGVHILWSSILCFPILRPLATFAAEWLLFFLCCPVAIKILFSVNVVSFEKKHLKMEDI